ncbi:MAG: prepilin-type N-terminal cleavage/methylation domain-containing protein [Candidatus Paceibacteria bacterium]|jgi:prepilin-type N-terminal cleavage/methylation domain-containing protein
MKKKGFTLIELLVVISIIGVLASIIITSLSDARTQAKNASVLTEMKSLETALELYYSDNNEYPNRDFNTSNGSFNGNAASFLSDMTSYMQIDLEGPSYRNPAGDNDVRFWYKSKPTTNYQSYAFMVQLKDSTAGADEDGGYYADYFEYGPDPRYCSDKYSGSGGNWFSGTDRCTGGM